MQKLNFELHSSYGIISIGFGVNVDPQFLRTLSERNAGAWKQIFEDAGAAVQVFRLLECLRKVLSFCFSSVLQKL